MNPESRELTVKINIDLEACVGAGQCVVVMPSVFDVDDDGKVILVDGVPGEEARAEVEAAAAACPAWAIEVEDDGAPA